MVFLRRPGLAAVASLSSCPPHLSYNNLSNNTNPVLNPRWHCENTCCALQRFCCSADQAPIYDAGKVICVCVGMNYTDHCTEQGFPNPSCTVFTRVSSLVRDGAAP